MRCATLLPSSLDLGHLRHREPHFIAVEFSDGGNAVDVLDEVFRCTEENLECRLAVASTKHVEKTRGQSPGFLKRFPERVFFLK